MTKMVEPPIKQHPMSSGPAPRGGSFGRWPIVLVMLASLILAGLSGGWASNWKDANAGAQPVVAQRGLLSGMNSYSLALMLGGLRGPLVMILWSKVENQKIDRDLEDVDTMIEWIRLLQPEFDTVHIFQIWNKAYNLSAMMASTGDKYTTILDAIDYARRVDADRPGDLNILDQMGRIFGEKLGGPNVSERDFYRKQFLEDSLTDANRKKAYPNDLSYHRMGFKFFSDKNEPLLDENNNLDPRLLVVRTPRPADLPASSEWNNGQEAQYIAKYQPFPYGVQAIAMGYNYAKRAQVAMTVGGQKSLNLSDMVVDSYPALLLKEWAEREQDLATDRESTAFGGASASKPDPFATAKLDPPSATPSNMHDLEAAAYGYGLAAKLAVDGHQEFVRHIGNTAYINPFMSYTSHMAEMKAQGAVTAGDYAYMRSFLPGADRAALFQEAMAHYRQGMTRYEKIVLTYYVEADVAHVLFSSVRRLNLDNLTDADTDTLYRQLYLLLKRFPEAQHEYDDTRGTYGAFIDRCGTRFQQLEPYLGKSVLEKS